LVSSSAAEESRASPPHRPRESVDPTTLQTLQEPILGCLGVLWECGFSEETRTTVWSPRGKQDWILTCLQRG
jgi:hypothetical protein